MHLLFYRQYYVAQNTEIKVFSGKHYYVDFYLAI